MMRAWGLLAANDSIFGAHKHSIMSVANSEASRDDKSEPAAVLKSFEKRQPMSQQSLQKSKDLAPFDAKSLIHMVRLAGIEPTTPWFVANL